MARTIEMPFKKGDSTTHYFKLPIADYVAGGTLFFTAKPDVDNDTTDAAAVIDKSFDDTVVDTDATYATWTLAFVAADIDVNFTSGEKKRTYIGEFQLVQADGSVHSYPDDDNYIKVIVYADVKRGTA